MANDTESAAAEALKDLKKGRFPSLRAATRPYGLTESRLRRRSKGILPKRLAHQKEARLSPKQEEDLVHWILHQEIIGHPITFSLLRDIAYRIVTTSGSSKSLGRN